MLFLDCVTQLLKMNPLSFEMNASYLAAIANSVYTNKYFEFVQSDECLGKDDGEKSASGRKTVNNLND